MPGDTELLVLPYAAASGPSFSKRIAQELNSGEWTRFRCAVAFARLSGNTAELMQAITAFVVDGLPVSMTFGADLFKDDAGTDYQAVEEFVKKFDGLNNFELFLYHEKGRVFHPKLYLFDNESADRALLVTGSSNWSRQAQTRSVEASIIRRLDLKIPDDSSLYQEASSYFNTYWATENTGNSSQGFVRRVDRHSLHNYKALLRDAKTANRRQTATSIGSTAKSAIVQAVNLFPGNTTGVSISATVLVSEFGGPGRWSQVAFTEDIFSNFFGGHTINLRRFDRDGSTIPELGVTPIRKRSSNYCYEIGAARGRYPSGGLRPIGIFVKRSSVDFDYCLLVPSDIDYSAVALFLKHHWQGSSHNLKRIYANLTDLSTAWPGQPFP